MRIDSQRILPDTTSQARSSLGLELSRLPIDDVLSRLGTSANGLSQEEVSRRLRQYGPNSLIARKGLPLTRRFLQQFTHFLAVLLFIAAGLSFLADRLKPGEGMATLAWVILGVIVVNAIFSFVQEYRAERAVQALRRLLPTSVWVVRAGRPEQRSRQEIVPGDILLLEEGEQLPADARLLEVNSMRVDNSSLTGESRPKRRTTDTAVVTHPLDAMNLVFAGTTVLSGHGRAVVYATGMSTEFGLIARTATQVESVQSPLQKEIVRITRLVAALSFLMGGLSFIVGEEMGLGVWVSAIFAIGIIVGNVPEGLLPTVTLALAMAGQRMARRKAIIKQLASVETLGCATVICTDKTGTLTENRMRAEQLFIDGGVIELREGQLVRQPGEAPVADFTQWRSLFRALALCNTVKPARRGSAHCGVIGDPTEVALVGFAHQYGTHEPVHPEAFRKMGELPFDAERKRMSTLHWVEGKLMAYVKGAPEVVLPLCRHVQHQGTMEVMSLHAREVALTQSRLFASQAYRVLAVAMRPIETGLAEHLSAETVERELTFLGLVALADPPRLEVPDAIVRCREAGVRVIMITGDHPLTALAVARKIGLVAKESRTGDETTDAVIEGSQLDGLTDEALTHLLEANSGKPLSIFARMAPIHKMRIVSLLKDMGEVVAVTGDGVNDAPALKKADIGIAMGVAGTDVAKETADMILMDDNFATIVHAIEEGRAVYSNIRKFVTYVLTHANPEVAPYLAYGLFAVPPALTVPQILAIDLGTDIVPALALGAEEPHPGIMQMPPRPRTERLLNRSLLLRIYLFLGLIEAGIAMAAFFWFLLSHGWTWGTPLNWMDPLYRQATSATLAAIVMAQVANVFACRSDRLSIVRLGFLSNRLILWGIGIELLLLISYIYTPIGNLVLGTLPLPWWVWGPLVLGAVGLLGAEELRKFLVSRLIVPRFEHTHGNSILEKTTR